MLFGVCVCVRARMPFCSRAVAGCRQPKHKRDTVAPLCGVRPLGGWFFEATGFVGDSMETNRRPCALTENDVHNEKVVVMVVVVSLVLLVSFGLGLRTSMFPFHSCHRSIHVCALFRNGK